MPTNYTAIANGAAANASTFNIPLQELDNAIEAVKDGSTALSAPDVTSFANAQHDHEDAAGGGKLTEDAINSGSETAGTALVADGSGGAEWGNAPVYARAYHNAAQSIASGGSGTALAFNSENFDSGTVHSTVTNTSRLTVPRNGYYLIGATIEWASLSTSCEVRLRVDGSTIIAKQTDKDDAAGVAVVSVSTLYYLTANQYVEVVAYIPSGGPINVNRTADYSPVFWIQSVD